jgi:hypothetical protein
MTMSWPPFSRPSGCSGSAGPPALHFAVARRQALSISLTTALLTELCGPDAYMFVTRHTDAYLRARYPPPTQVAPFLYCPQVGVDGSLREAARGQPAKGAGAAAFLTAEAGEGGSGSAPTLTAHIVTSLYSGEQSVANSEYAGLTTALQTDPLPQPHPVTDRL